MEQSTFQKNAFFNAFFKRDIFVHTDYEPDDQATLTIIFKYYAQQSSNHTLTIVVGEGDVKSKAACVHYHWNLIKQTLIDQNIIDPIILLGTPSNGHQEYQPFEGLQYFETKQQFDQYKDQLHFQKADQTLDQLFSNQSSPTTIIAIKPIRDLFHRVINQPNKMPHNLIIYGGFNLGPAKNNKKDFFYNKWNMVFFMERYPALGGDRAPIGNQSSLPNIANFIKSTGQLGLSLGKAAFNWNKPIYQDALESIQKAVQHSTGQSNNQSFDHHLLTLTQSQIEQHLNVKNWSTQPIQDDWGKRTPLKVLQSNWKCAHDIYMTYNGPPKQFHPDTFQMVIADFLLIYAIFHSQQCQPFIYQVDLNFDGWTSFDNKKPIKIDQFKEEQDQPTRVFTLLPDQDDQPFDVSNISL